MKRLFALALGVVAVGACGEAGPTGPALRPGFSRNPLNVGARGITVLTRNIYLGADLDPVLTAPPAQIPLVVAQTFAKIQATNFPERAGRLAQEIADAAPHLVGLQEVALYRRQSPGDAVVGGTIPATTVVIDFQQLLLDSLAARGLTYTAVATHTGLDVELPMLTGIGPAGPTFDDIRFTDHDVILARNGVRTANPLAANYAVNLPVSVGGTTVFILRGWAAVDAEVGGVSFRFVDTHLETQVAPAVQEAQATELITILSRGSAPLVLVGDFNSAANMFQTRSYDLLRAAGFADVWAQLHPRDPGLTCCQAPDLLNARSTFDQRLDLVLWRDPFNGETDGEDNEQRGGFRAFRVDILGEAPADRTASGLWPSDHAGVAATLKPSRELARN